MKKILLVFAMAIAICAMPSCNKSDKASNDSTKKEATSKDKGDRVRGSQNGGGRYDYSDAELERRAESMLSKFTDDSTELTDFSQQDFEMMMLYSLGIMDQAVEADRSGRDSQDWLNENEDEIRMMVMCISVATEAYQEGLLNSNNKELYEQMMSIAQDLENGNY